MLRFFFSELLQSFSQIFVVSERDAERFTALGAHREVVSVVGNTKYDAAPSLVGDDEIAALRVKLFPDLAERPDAKIVVLGSVRPSEEEGWISGVKSLLTQGYDIRLVVAPRHAEKFPYFRDKLDTAGLSWRAYSEIVLGNGPVDGLRHAEPLTSRKVVLLDTMGVLKSVYGIADLAFIGATLVDIGGHNPLEASMYGCPVCVGPFTSVVKEICDDLSQEGALVRLTSAEEIEPLLSRFRSSPEDFQSMGARGKRVWKRYTGATAKIVGALLHPRASDLGCNVNNDDELRK
jgi:3-deoxy-D-manno-octulosonic-acid transferase